MEFKIHKKTKSFTSVTPLTFPEEWSKEVSQAIEMPAIEIYTPSLTTTIVHSVGQSPSIEEDTLATRQQTANNLDKNSCSLILVMDVYYFHK